MNRIQNDAAEQAAFAEVVLELLAGRRADPKSGTRADELSLSTLLERLRYCGWCIGDREGAADTLRAAGFAVREHRAGGALRQYVTL